MKMKKFLLLLLLALSGCRCTCNCDTDKLLAELDKRYAEGLAELDRRYAERQPTWWQPFPLQQWQQQPTWWQWQPTWWQWRPTWWQWQPTWWQWQQWYVPVPEPAEPPDTPEEVPEPAEPADTPEEAPEHVESGPCPEAPELPYLSPPEWEQARRLALSHLKAGKYEYERGYFTDTEREELTEFINKTLKAIQDER